MAGEDKPFPASDYKLSQLRRAGVIAYSPMLTASALAIGTLAGVSMIVSMVGDDLGAMFRRSATVTGALTPEMMKTEWFVGGKFLLTAIGELLLLSVSAVLIVGFIQSRFYFSPRSALPNLGRLFRLQPAAVLLPAKRTFRTLLLVLLWLAIVAAYGMSVSGSSLPVFPQLAFSEKQGLFLHAKPRSMVQAVAIAQDASASGRLLAHELLAALNPLLWYSAIFFLLVGILSRVVVHVEYLQRHRMTRSELEAEIREMEMRPELRRGLRGPIQE